MFYVASLSTEVIWSPKSFVSVISVFYLQQVFVKGLSFLKCDIKFDYSGVWRWYTEYNSGPNFKLFSPPYAIRDQNISESEFASVFGWNWKKWRICWGGTV
jgi:hypothetical protein